MTTMTERFRALHAEGTFLMPNPWDVGSARYLEWRGFPAVATTSSGFAGTLGRQDQQVSLDELLGHTELLTGSLSIPLNVDSERLFADDLAGIGRSVELLAAAGAAGCSIEDYDPATGDIDEPAKATERVAVAAEAARRHDVVLTARTENHLYRKVGLDDTIERLRSFAAVGAEVLYAPGLTDPAEIAEVVTAVEAPVNVLLMPSGPTVGEATEAGARRISTGGALAWAALGGLKGAVDELYDTGTSTYMASSLSGSDRAGSWG